MVAAYAEPLLAELLGHLLRSLSAQAIYNATVHTVSIGQPYDSAYTLLLRGALYHA